MDSSIKAALAVYEARWAEEQAIQASTPLEELRRDYAWAIDLTICVFPQEGLLDDPGCEDVLISAM